MSSVLSVVNPLPLAFGFANVAILGWLVAAAAPILIHLWMKRVRRETEWAAVRFLRKAIERHSRKLKLREWLLLAIRTAIILLIVLAAAKPVLDSLGLAGPGVRTHYLLVMDASLSMRYQTDDGSLLEQAKRLATKLIDDSRSGDVFSLMVMASPPRAVVPQPTSDGSRVRRAVESVEPTDGGADLDAVLRVAQQILDRSKEQTSHVDRHEVVVFTDLARHTWSAVAGEADATAGGVRGHVAALAKAAELSIIDLGVDGAVNHTVSRLAIADPLPTSGRPLRVTATVNTHGPISGMSEQPVERSAELLVNEVSVATQTIATSGSLATMDFTHRFDRPGVNTIELRIGDDRLPADNSAWLGATLPEQTRVLCVAGGPGAARYVANALRPGRGEDQAIEPVVVSDAQLTSVDLSEFAAVFFCNVAQLSPREAELVENYVRGGGGAVFFLGDRVLPEAYNRVLAGGAGQGGLGLQIEGATRPAKRVADNETAHALLPTTLDQPVDSQSFTIDPLDYSHPIVQPFEGRERAGLLTTPIARYWRLVVSDEANDAEVAIASTAGDPLMVTSTVGRGRVAVVATAASLASVDATTGEPWTVMPAWPSFLPIVRGLLNHTVGGGESADRVVVGETIAGGATGEIEIVRPDERVVPAASSNGVGWSYADSDRAGVYLARRPGSLNAEVAVGVNVAPSESDLTRIAPGSLPDEWQVRRVASQSMAGEALSSSTGIHRTLLLAALALVLLETLLAYWFGRPPA